MTSSPTWPPMPTANWQLALRQLLGHLYYPEHILQKHATKSFKSNGYPHVVCRIRPWTDFDDWNETLLASWNSDDQLKDVQIQVSHTCEKSYKSCLTATTKDVTGEFTGAFKGIMPLIKRFDARSANPRSPVFVTHMVPACEDGLSRFAQLASAKKKTSPMRAQHGLETNVIHWPGRHGMEPSAFGHW